MLLWRVLFPNISLTEFIGLRLQSWFQRSGKPGYLGEFWLWHVSQYGRGYRRVWVRSEHIIPDRWGWDRCRRWLVKESNGYFVLISHIPFLALYIPIFWLVLFGFCSIPLFLICLNFFSFSVSLSTWFGYVPWDWRWVYPLLHVFHFFNRDAIDLEMVSTCTQAALLWHLWHSILFLLLLLYLLFG